GQVSADLLAGLPRGEASAEVPEESLQPTRDDEEQRPRARLNREPVARSARNEDKSTLRCFHNIVPEHEAEAALDDVEDLVMVLVNMRRRGSRTGVFDDLKRSAGLGIRQTERADRWQTFALSAPDDERLPCFYFLRAHVAPPSAGWDGDCNHGSSRPSRCGR